ncbi:MAG: NAD(P)/FAD-dependent oxidoreductase [Flavipsychrobacter sp.]
MEVQKLTTKAIIVGAGPGGAGTSFYLTKAGIPHIVIDKATFPRDKICGDACSGKTALVLRRANPDWLNDEIFTQEEQFMPSHGIIFVAPNGKDLHIPFNPNRQPEDQAPGFTTKRLVFDNFLFEKIPSEYSTIFQGAKIREIKKEANSVTVFFEQNGKSYEVTAPVIVGADGDKGITRKTLLTDHNSAKAYAVGLRAYYKGVKGLNKDNFIELHFLPELLPGYFWIFPMPNGLANVGVGILSDVVREKKINLRERMLDAIKNNPNIKDRFADAELEDKIHGWGLPMAMEQLPISGDNFVLVGDAASLIDPFSGEGIGNALYSGMLAAEAIVKATEANDYSRATLEKEYDAVVYKRLGDEFKISATLQRLCRFPWLFNFVVNKAKKSKSLSDTISCMFTDMDLRDKLRKPSFYFNILFNR